MKKLYPEAPDLSQNAANRAVRIIERHLKVHGVTRARELPEEARVRLYRDLRLFFEGASKPPPDASAKSRSSIAGFMRSIREALDDFLSAFNANHRHCPSVVSTGCGGRHS